MAPHTEKKVFASAISYAVESYKATKRVNPTVFVPDNIYHLENANMININSLSQMFESHKYAFLVYMPSDNHNDEICTMCLKTRKFDITEPKGADRHYFEGGNKAILKYAQSV